MAEPGRRTLLLRVALVAAGLAVLVLGGRQLAGLIPAFVARVTALGPLAPVVFMLAYAAAVVAFIPGSLLTLAAGAAFGLGRGVVVVLLGATLGGSLAFLIARYVARARVAQAVAASPRFAAIDRAIGRDGRRIVFLLRLSPVFPFNLLNYGLGLTTVRFVDYLVASLGMLPGTILYVYYGKVAGDVAALASGAAPARGAGHYAVLALGLAATIGVTVLVTRTARRALAEAGA
ncbi:MAG: TVP38/TMEM64 family protein [Gemmatimonadetes bacterium]|nr:TVP38/TMEM64 family protein [Gemmatimonadota bacterium]